MKAKTLAATAAMLATTSISAAEIKVLASNGVKEALNELAPAFERATGNKLVITFGLAAALKRQIEAGEAFDLAILPAAGLNDLAKQGKVDARASASIARSGVEIGKLVASGKVQLGVILVNELMAAPGVEVLGPLPPGLQNYTVFHAGVGVGSKDSSAAKALIKFLTTPTAGAVFRAKGQEAG